MPWFKVEAGANFAVTQPVFDAEHLARFLKRIKSAGIARIPILAGVYPLTSFRNAEFLNNEVPGVSVPPAVMERMRKADTGDQARAEGVKIARELLAQIRQLVQGVQISAPFGRYAMAVEVASVLRERARAVSDQLALQKTHVGGLSEPDHTSRIRTKSASETPPT